MGNQLYHYGVLGMKWGVRKANRTGGSLSNRHTHRTKDPSRFDDKELNDRVNRLNKAKEYRNLTKSTSKGERTKKALDATSNLVNQAKNVNKEYAKSRVQQLDLSSMSDKDLRDYVNRKNLERQYKDILAQDSASTSRGQAYTSNVLEIAGSALALGSSALGIALAIKELKG